MKDTTPSRRWLSDLRLPFRTRLLLGFGLVVGITATVTTLAGISFISRTVTEEAMRRVEMDVGAAWAAFEAERSRVQIAVSMAAQREAVRAVFRTGAQAPAAQTDLRLEMENLRLKYDLDFLTLVDSSGAAVVRSRFPYASGDRVGHRPVVGDALGGSAASGTRVIDRDELRLEGEELADRAFIPLIYTDHAAPSTRTAESRGMVLVAAMPILDARERVVGALYGGVLLNRKFGLVDKIRDAVFGDMSFKGKPVGTVTLFLDDVRIATNVMLDAGTRALGTRVSQEVQSRVLEGGRRFADRAFVVNDWYLSAYDPIRDPDGKVIGIVYVGLLEKKYLGYRTTLALQFLGLSLLSLLLSVAVALYLSGGYKKPVEQLVRATRELSAGNLQTRVTLGSASREMTELAAAFNSMAAELDVDREELERAAVQIRNAYREVEERNRAYLEMLGFVTHELKSPLASIVFAIGSLREAMLGPLNQDQQSVLKSAATSADYLAATIANYLNLSRIEEGELKLHLSRVSFLEEIVEPLVERLAELAGDRGIRIVCEVPAELTAVCDRDLISSVFQNLLSNALKYGREGGLVRIEGQSTDGEEWLRFRVWNEGVGFDGEAAERLFRRFSRLGAAGGETKPGTGLGLFVTRMIVEKHGGQIRAASEPGRWAEFIVELPGDAGSTEALGDGQEF